MGWAGLSGRLSAQMLQNSHFIRYKRLLANIGNIDNHFARVRWVSTFVGIEAPCAHHFVNRNRDSSIRYDRKHNLPQRREFLGVNDGDERNALSRTYKESRVVGYSQEQLFSVVAAVDMYEDFLPWCQHSRIIRRNSDGSFDAELQIGFKFLVESYVSHVELKKPELIKTTVSDSSLFDHLVNIWKFNPGPIPGTCDLYFFVDFKFQSPLYRQVATMFFKEVVSCLVGSFSDRCRLIYGPSISIRENPYG